MVQGHFGLPLYCPRCSVRREVWTVSDGSLIEVFPEFYAKLKLPGIRVDPCPNCGQALVPRTTRRQRQRARRERATQPTQ